MMVSMEEVPYVALCISIMKHTGMILEHRHSRLQRYFYLSVNTIQNIFQFAYLFTTTEIEKLILNGYFALLFLKAIIRAINTINQRHYIEKFLAKVEFFYNTFANSKDPYISNLIKEDAIRAHHFSTMNFWLAIICGFAFQIYPIFSGMKDLPFSLYIPGIDTTKSPYYGIIYISEVFITTAGACLYVHFSNLLTAFCMITVVLVKILKYKITNLKNPDDTDEVVTQKLHNLIEFHKLLIQFVDEINHIVTYICLYELVFFVLLLCALLFVQNIVKLLPQLLMSCLYIFLIMTQLFSLYWNANELWVESLDIPQTIYFSPWYDMNQSTKMKLMVIMARTQKPLQITAGNIYPLTLQMFQTLLNGSYSYFTVLRRYYNK